MGAKKGANPVKHDKNGTNTLTVNTYWKIIFIMQNFREKLISIIFNLKLTDINCVGGIKKCKIY